jgi:hypothetical protein
MLKLLRRLLGGGEEKETERLLRQYQQLKEDLGADLPLEDLRPVLIPSSILSGGNWFGPHHHFPELPLSLTWAYVRPEHTMQYLSQEQADKLTAEGADWKTTARTALAADSKARTWTFRRNPENESLCAAIVLHEMIPNGFTFVVPNRDTVFLLADDAPREIRDQMAEWVHKAYREADVPMSMEAHTQASLENALREAGELS